MFRDARPRQTTRHTTTAKTTTTLLVSWSIVSHKLSTTEPPGPGGGGGRRSSWRFFSRTHGRLFIWNGRRLDRRRCKWEASGAVSPPPHSCSFLRLARSWFPSLTVRTPSPWFPSRTSSSFAGRVFASPAYPSAGLSSYAPAVHVGESTMLRVKDGAVSGCTHEGTQCKKSWAGVVDNGQFLTQ